MAKKSSRVYAGMGSIKGTSKEVNPTYSLKKAPVATPASKKQVNPTYAGNAKAEKTGSTHRTRVNPTFAVANPGAEKSKGKTGQKFVAMKSKMGSAIASKANPNKPNIGTSKKTFATPTKNIKGGIGSGRAVDAKAGKTHTLSSAHDVSIPTRNTSAPYGPNGTAPVPMTVKRLKKLGY